jgi:hypothetical protein
VLGIGIGSVGVVPYLEGEIREGQQSPDHHDAADHKDEHKADHKDEPKKDHKADHK